MVHKGLSLCSLAVPNSIYVAGLSYVAEMHWIYYYLAVWVVAAVLAQICAAVTAVSSEQ